MAELSLTKGDTVDIFEDPIDCTRLEGHAELVELVKDDSVMSGLQYWMVHFTNADDDADTLRAVNISNY